MTFYTLTHPTSSLARGIEDLVVYAERFSLPGKIACHAVARLVSLVVFPVFLTLELACKRFPKMLWAIGTEKFARRADKALTYLFSIIPSIIFALHSPEGMPGFVLKRKKSSLEIRPFGVEELFGKSLENKIVYPKTAEEVAKIVLSANEQGAQVSIIGAGMSQGTQTVPGEKAYLVIHTKHLNQIQVNAAENTVTAGAGATWEEVQLELDKVGKSIIVKQASDPFSVGGTIGMNAHGWAHEFGAIARVVRSLKMIDANGELRELFAPRAGAAWEELTDDEKLFKCMFGTLGYFGVVVEATFDIVDNEELIEKMEEVDRDHFLEVYETKIKGQDIPLFGGRLILDSLDGDPMRTICMVSYHKTGNGLQNRQIAPEPSRGRRIERIILKLVSHLSDFSVHHLISRFWKKEKTAMGSERVLTRNEALHPPINAFNLLHHSNLHAQWLQEYFLNRNELSNFLRFLGAELRANDIRLINSTIRPTPRDDISILPYADEDRHAVVISFAQRKSPSEIKKTKQWIENVNEYLVAGERKGVFYQAYMPWATREQFEKAYGKETVERLRACKAQFDSKHVFGNAHTAKYYDEQEVF